MRAAVGSEEIYWIVTCIVQPGRLTDFKQLVGALVTATEGEPGTLDYEFSIDADQSTVHIFERYRDSDAVVSHVMQTFGSFAERFLSCVTVSRFVVYGSPSAEVQVALAGFSPAYMIPFDGFTR